MTDLNPLHLIGEVNRQIGNSTASVLEYLGITDELVDPDGVRDIARSWKDLADALDEQCSAAGFALLDVVWAGDTPAAITSQVGQARHQASSVADQLHDGAQQLRQFADQAHEAIVEIGILAAEIIEWEAVGLALSVLTAGLSACATTIAAGARAVRIVALVERISQAGAALLRTIEGLAASVRGLGTALRALRVVARAGARGAVDALGMDSIDLLTATGRVNSAADVQRDVLWGAAGGAALGGLALGARAMTPAARAALQRLATAGGDDAGEVSLELLLPLGQLSRLVALVRREGQSTPKLFSPEERVALDEYRAGLATKYPADFEAFLPDQDIGGRPRVDETLTALHMREMGTLPQRTRRPVQGEKGDFMGVVDGKDVSFDIKSFRDTWEGEPGGVPGARMPANKGGFQLTKVVDVIEKAIRRDQTVILDVKHLNQENVAKIVEAIEERGWGRSVLWYP